jgi:hypothetical protein
MKKRAIITIAVITLLLAGLAGCSRSDASANGAAAKRIIVLGIDGMDPGFLERHWVSLPNLNRLRQEGEMKRLETTMPPQSPVAWSTFIAGMDPGGHGLFDFVHRNPQTLAPFSSMAQTAEGTGRTLSLGPYVLPLSSGHVVSFRKGTPFWQVLSEHHVPVNIIRMPTNFPPIQCEEGYSVAGMGTPDLRGTFGTFTYLTDEESQKTRQVPGGQIVHVNLNGYRADLQIPGPANSLRKDKSTTYVDMTADMDPDGKAARFTIADQQVILREGEWSEWIQVRFPLIPKLKSAAGMVRIFAKKFHPNLQAYVSPVNIDPTTRSCRLRRGIYSRDGQIGGAVLYTGMAQDTSGAATGVFNRASTWNKAGACQWSI